MRLKEFIGYGEIIMTSTSKANYLHAISYFLLGLVAYGIGYKIWHIPITHDETATAIYYSKFTAWQIMMYPDNWPNNHILNTLLVKCSISLFGAEQWSVRLPSFISFGLYAWAAVRISDLIFGRTSIMILGSTALFVANPYLLDFFGLSRGYGMAAAMALLSLSFMVEGFLKDKVGKVWVAIIVGVLASYANFSLLLFLAATSLIGFIFFSIHFYPKTNLKKWATHIGALFILVLLYGALITVPILKMQTTNQFQYWTSNGFFKDTIFSSTESWRYNANLFFEFDRMVLAYLVVVIVILALARLIWHFRKTTQKEKLIKSPLFVCTSVLLLTGMINLCQNKLLGTPNLLDRTALFFYPLFIAVLLSLLGDVLSKSRTQKMPSTVLSVGLLALSALHLIDRYNSKAVRDWTFNANTINVLNYLNNSRNVDTEEVTLKTHWLYHPSFIFYTSTGKADWLNLYDYDKQIDTLTDAQYYYIFNTDYELLKNNYNVIDEFNGYEMLLKRKN